MNKKVLRAIYGIDTTYFNVTQLALQNNVDLFSCIVSNELLGGDPCYGKLKRMLLLYIENGKVYYSCIPEGMSFESGQEIGLVEGLSKFNLLFSQEGVHDFFIKTCKKDEKWLEFSLKSIDKFALGFRQVVILADRGDSLTFSHLDLKIPIKYIEVDTPVSLYEYKYGIGYWWQQGVKMSWNLFSNADAVVILDSDCIFFDYVMPMDWHHLDKPIWLYVKWSEAEECLVWKEGIEKIFSQKSEKTYMAAQGFYITRKLILDFQNYLLQKYYQHPLSLFVNPSFPNLSEFNLLGSFLEYQNRNEYSLMEAKTMPNLWPIKQYWSWGGIEGNSEELERLLSEND